MLNIISYICSNRNPNGNIDGPWCYAITIRREIESMSCGLPQCQGLYFCCYNPLDKFFYSQHVLLETNVFDILQ